MEGITVALLDSKTHTAVKRLAKSTCASFIDGGCVLTGGACDYFASYGRDISCDYFESSVLGNDPILEQAYKVQHGITHREDKANTANVGNCVKCGTAYVKSGNRQLYCKACSTVKQREQSRNHMRNKRSN